MTRTTFLVCTRVWSPIRVVVHARVMQNLVDRVETRILVRREFVRLDESTAKQPKANIAATALKLLWQACLNVKTELAARWNLDDRGSAMGEIR